MEDEMKTYSFSMLTDRVPTGECFDVRGMSKEDALANVDPRDLLEHESLGTLEFVDGVPVVE
jgi:hypothetical protein